MNGFDATEWPGGLDLLLVLGIESDGIHALHALSVATRDGRASFKFFGIAQLQDSDQKAIAV